MPPWNRRRSSKPSTSGPDAQPVAATTQGCPGCKAYEDFDRSKDPESYNCAGLALRTYGYPDLGELKAELASRGARTMTDCAAKCGACEVKLWLWEFDVHLEDADGNVLLTRTGEFHTVAGPCDQNGEDPTRVLSKDGKRPVEGLIGPDFAPPVKHQAKSNEENPVLAEDSQGRPIYIVYTNVRETCYCFPCPSP